MLQKGKKSKTRKKPKLKALLMKSDLFAVDDSRDDYDDVASLASN